MKRSTHTFIAALALCVLTSGFPSAWIAVRPVWGKDVQKGYFNRLLNQSPGEEPGERPAEPREEPPPESDTVEQPPAPEAAGPGPDVQPAEPEDALKAPEPEPRRSPPEAQEASVQPDREPEPKEVSPSSPFLPDERVSAGARRVVEALGARLQGRSTANFDPDLTFGPEAEARLTAPFQGPRTSLLNTFVRTDRREGSTPGSRTVSGLLAFAEASGRRVLMSFQADFIQDGDQIWIRRLSLDEPE